MTAAKNAIHVVSWLLNYRIIMFVKSAVKKSTLFKDFVDFKRSFSKKMGKIPNPLIIHLLGGDYCSIVLDNEPIRLLQSPRSLSVYILNICPQN